MTTAAPLPRRAKGAVIGGLIAVGALTLAGCGSASPESVSTSIEGGELVIGTYLDPTCLDPQQIATNASLSVTRQLVDSLTDQDPETGEIVPWLASDWEINDDSTIFTFHLRDDVTFSDDSEFTAQTVKDNFDGILALGSKAAVANGYLAGLVSTTVLDTHTVEFAFGTPNAQFLQATANIPLGMVSSATAAMSAEERCASGVVGSGPFIIESYETNDSAVLVKREDYDWGSPTWNTQGPAHLDRVTFQVLPENSVRTGALLSGQVDVMDNVQQQDVASVSSNGFHIVDRANPGFVVSITFNLASAIGGDDAVRKAVMIAIDREELVGILGPTGAPTLGVLSPTTPGAADFSSYLDSDPDAAAEILDEGGWAMGSDGVREKDGLRLELAFPYFFDGPVVEAMQQQLAPIGIRLNIQQVTTAEYLTALSTGAFDASVGNLTRADIDVLRSMMSSVGANYFGYDDVELQELLVAQAAEADPEARVAIALEIQEHVLESAYVVPLHSLAQGYAAADSVNDLKFEASSRLQLHDTWITK